MVVWGCDGPRQAGIVKTAALGYAALKTGSECSFTARKLECEPSPLLACFGLAFPSFATFAQRLQESRFSVHAGAYINKSHNNKNNHSG
jgi:hypothetical protein